MWNFLMGLLLGDVIAKSPAGRFVRPVLKLFAVGVLIAGLIYAYVVFRAVYEGSHAPHVDAHSTH
jgi:hypothetical protein